MPIVQTVLALTVLSILYARMVKREVPEPVTKGQAITPIILGVVSVSLPLSFIIFLGSGFALNHDNFQCTLYTEKKNGAALLLPQSLVFTTVDDFYRN